MKSILKPFSSEGWGIIFAIFCYWFLSPLQSNAQTIVPDASFAQAIRGVCPTCIDASNKLLPPAATLASLDVSGKGISDLTGIGGFTTLKMLNCQSNKLTQLPSSLPATLTTLLCDVNQITTLPTLPAGLNALSCNYNQLAFLPNLPDQLQAITCNNNQLTQIPVLPKTLMALSCTNNLLTALPELPEKLQLLFCTTNRIGQLPALPSGLTTLYCQDNPVSCLPNLPNTLSVLYIDTDKIGCLTNAVAGLKVYNSRGNLVENLPICVFVQDPKFAEAIRNSCPSCIGVCNNLTVNAASLTSLYISGQGITSLEGIENFTSLQQLSCSNNALSGLPSNLPKTLTNLDCSNNALTTLPILPNQLVTLNCSSNRLNSIDNLPPNLTQLYCNGNVLTTLPKLPATLSWLYCQDNQLISLPELPLELIHLTAPNNQLNALPTLPSNLQSIDVNFNRLTSLPALPHKLSSLNCSNNAIKCLPFLPNSLYSLYISNTEITCLPNQVNGLNASNSTGNNLPICGLKNPEFQKVIQSVCPSCFDDCFKIVTAETAKITTLNLSGKSITNLEGIELFPNLQSLNISNNPLLNCLPALPKSLTSLTIDTDKITCLTNSNLNLKVYNAAGQLIPTPAACIGFIPDANFAQVIRNACTTCIDNCNNLLPPAETLKELQIYAQNITDFKGIELLKNLKTLFCYYSPLSNLPTLPLSLESLIWTNGQLKVLTNLPNTIVTIDCFNNQIEQIGTLPKNLQRLNLSSNQLPTIENLPNTLTYLGIHNNKISSLPQLPNTLTYLGFSNNKVGSLPQLPDNLLELFCENNLLTSLPSLPKKIFNLSCANNNLTKLPELPNTLIYLNCSSNLSLTCLPLLPQGLQYLSIYNNNITCLPNSPSNLNIYGSFSSPLPLCGIADGNLARALKEACPACFDECFKLIHEEAAKVTSLDLSGKNINNLDGLEAFSGLQSLNVSNNALICIPTLPKTVTSFTIDADKITCLPIQNPNLKVYNAAGQLITPALCTGFISDANFAKAIRNACSTCIDACNNLLPPAKELKYLSLYGYNISDLTGIEGFTNLETLYCIYNKLSSLPKLPPNLTYLDCSNNQLTTLSNLPATLTTLSCNYNLLTELPPLPKALKNLSCENNNLKRIPSLPSTLTHLNCSQNISLICLPLLPQSLQSLSIYGNRNINCLPNAVKYLNVNGNFSGLLPLCGVADANFQQAIQEICPSCFDECLKLIPAEVTKITSLNLTGKNISSLVGIEAFTALQSLNLSNNTLICIPYLPQTLTTLTIDADKITCLPSYNPNLKVFNAAGQPISPPVNCTGFIPDVNFAKAIRNSCSYCIDDCNNLLPPAKEIQSLYLSSSYKISDLTGIEGFTNLQSLDCNNNSLSILPKLPSKLTFLDCSYNQLKQLSVLPETLKTLQVSNNQLTQLPKLPDALQNLNCSNNQLIQLPILPEILQSLNCSNNQLTQLPVVPETLKTLQTTNNQLTQLPKLPRTIQELNCSNNQLSQLPQLPDFLQALYCHNNQLTCLSNLPANLTYLQFDSDKIGCLPNPKTNLSRLNQYGEWLPNYAECSNPIILSEISVSSPNPIIVGGTVTFTVKRNYTGTVSTKWQRKKANESDFSDFSPATTLYGISSDLTYTLTNLTLADHGNSYRVAVVSTCLGTVFSKATTVEVKDLPLVAPTITSSPRDTVCVGQTVQLSAICPAGATTEWNTGATGTTISVISGISFSRSYTAKCVLGDKKTANSSIKVIVWKPFEVTMINIGQSKSGTKSGANVPLSAWSDQFILPDAGPELKKSTQANPTIYYIENTNKTAPRYWTAYVDACDLPSTGSISYDMLATPETGVAASFNTHENNAPYLMYANREGFTELYAQNNPFFGFYVQDGNGQNRYDAGLPKGLYKLSIRYWNQKGIGQSPSLRTPQGAQLSYQEHWFRIQSKAGIGIGATRTGNPDNKDEALATIAPNPASKYFTLTIQNAKNQEVQYQLIDLSGRTLMQRKVIPETNTHSEYIDVSLYTAGMYLMHVNTPTQQTVLKLMKIE
jgi:Leucine-rich repeat (LRR) protein